MLLPSSENELLLLLKFWSEKYILYPCIRAITIIDCPTRRKNKLGRKGRYKAGISIDHIFNFIILLCSERTAYSYVCFFCFAAGADGRVEVLSREKLMFVFYLLDMSEISLVL